MLLGSDSWQPTLHVGQVGVTHLAVLVIKRVANLKANKTHKDEEDSKFNLSEVFSSCHC